MKELKISKNVLIAIFIFFLVFSIHIFLLVDHEVKENEIFQKYLKGAEQYVKNQLPLERITDFSPVYLYFHSFVKQVLNEPARFIQIFQLVLMAFTSVFLFLMLRLFFPMYISLPGTIVFSLLPEVIIYGRVMEPEPFMIFFLSGFLYFFTKFIMDKGIKKTIFLLISAIFFALSLLTRSNFFVLLIIIPAFIIYMGKKTEKNINYSLKMAFIFLFPSLIAIIFLWIRNYNIDGGFLPYFQNPGYILYEGNNPNSTGQSAIYPPLVDEMVYENMGEPDIHHQIYRDFARSITGKDLSIAEVNNFWSNKARNFIFDHPVRFIKLSLTKLHFFFHDYSRHDVAEAYLYRKRLNESRFPIFPFWIISSLAIFGFALNIRSIFRFFPQYIVFVTQIMVLVAGYVSARQRFAVIPVFIFFASAAVFFVIKNRKKILFFIPVLVLSFLLLFLRTDIMQEEDFLWEVYGKSHKSWIKALKLRNMNKGTEAKKNAAESLLLTPWLLEERQPASLDFGKSGFAGYSAGLIKNEESMNFSEKYNYSILLIQAGKFKKAENILYSLISDGHKFKRDFDHSSQPYYYLGLIDVKQNRYYNAISKFKIALDKVPGSPFSLAYLYVLTGDLQYRLKLFRYFDRISSSFFIGKAFLNSGDPEKASEYFRYVVNRIPEFRKGLIYLSAALSRSEQYKYALKYYIDAIKKRIEPVMLKEDILSIFEHAVNEEPWNGRIYYYYGVVLEQFGKFEEALKSYSRGIDIMPGNNLILKRIDLLKNKLSRN